MKKPYINRIFDKIIEFSLQSKGAVLIEGPKWCGKSRTAEQFAKTKLYMQDNQNKDRYIKMAKLAPNDFLNIGPKPIMIDEWQEIPFIWDSIRFQIDKNDDFGQYILTGSATPVDNIGSHTGTGRITTKLLRTMSLFESGESNGTISLNDLINNKFPKKAFSNLLLKDYAYLICRGGWPLAINENKKIALQQVYDYLDGLVKKDIFNVPGINIKHNERKARDLLRSYSRGISSSMTSNSIIKDLTTNNTFDSETLNDYLLALEKLHVIEELEAWCPNLRSKTAIRTKNIRHFVDPSIAVASLGLTPDMLYKDFNTFGLLFESLVIRDLRIYAEVNNAKLYHYRDKKDREIDAVIVFPNGDYGAVKVKLGNEEEITESIKKMNTIISDIDIKYNKPIFKAVITGTSAFEIKEDNTYIIPLGLLKD